MTPRACWFTAISGTTRALKRATRTTDPASRRRGLAAARRKRGELPALRVDRAHGPGVARTAAGPAGQGSDPAERRHGRALRARAVPASPIAARLVLQLPPGRRYPVSPLDRSLRIPRGTGRTGHLVPAAAQSHLRIV